MDAAILNTGLAFVEGLGLIVSPCILPILPIILSSSIDGDKKRPLGITVGFVLTFALFTLFSRKLVQYSGIDLNVIRHISFGLLALLGVIMLSTTLTEYFAKLTQRFATVGANNSALNNPQGGFSSGVVFGALIGLIWTPCAGPILAAVIVQTVLQKTSLGSFFVVFAFGLGAGIPMFLIALFGRSLMMKLGLLKQHSGLLRKILGGIILASVLYMIYSDTYANTNTTLEKTQSFQTTLVKGLSDTYPAPPIVGISDWINSSPLELSQLKGKVVLIDFWTYSCINCIRTLPYIKDWYAKYHDKGLVIIGIHTPEFDFEKNVENVKKAVAKFGILYPVALDNQFATWQSFHNQYWPAHYLIDKNGRVVYEHFGEGDYDVTENNIRFLLGESEQATSDTAIEDPTAGIATPETYLGYARAKTYCSPEKIQQNTAMTYSYPKILSDDHWALKGKWIVQAQNITAAEANASIEIRFQAKNVFTVMGNTSDHAITVHVTLDGKKQADIIVKDHALYDTLAQTDNQTGVLELTTSAPGLEIYTYTFGN